MQMIQEKIKQYINHYFIYNISSLTVQGHRKVYNTGFAGNKQIIHILYSEKFQAITHYLLTHNIKEIYNFKESFKGLLALLVLTGVYVATIVAAPSEVTGIMANTVEKVGGVSPFALQFIGGSITTSLIMCAIAIVVFVLSEIRNFFK
jgi:hypothetical protein